MTIIVENAIEPKGLTYMVSVYALWGNCDVLHTANLIEAIEKCHTEEIGVEEYMEVYCKTRKQVIYTTEPSY